MITTAALKNALSKEAEVIERDDPNYDQMRRQFGYYHGTEEEAKAKLSPERIVVPADETDVQAVVKLASLHGYTVAVRSGGHSYTATSSTNGEKTIQLDMKNFTKVKFEEAAKQNTRRNFDAGATKERYLVSVEPGVKLGNLAPAVAKYNCVIPMGVCMNVAAGGHFQTSGYGMLMKHFGYGVEYVSSVKLVLASGETIVADRTSHPELFWALRGGSPGAFGVALEYQIEATNAFYYNDITYGSTLLWDYSEEKANEILSALFRMSASKEYSTRKNMFFLYTVSKSFSDLSTIFSLASKNQSSGGAEYKIVVSVQWCGVEGGSIQNKIPDALREEGDNSFTYYDYYIGALKTIPGVTAHEYFPDGDKETALLSRLALAGTYGQNSIGAAKDLIEDRKTVKHLYNQTKPTEEKELLQRFEDHGIDFQNEQVRHAIVARHCTHYDFDHASLIGFYQKYIREGVQTKDSPLQSQICFSNNVSEPFGDCALQSFGKIKIDIWFQWRNSSPAEVVERMKTCAAEFDHGLTSILQREESGKEKEDGTMHVAFPMDHTNLSQERVRKQYYPDTSHYQTIQVVKQLHDPSNVFRTNFTVPPADSRTIKNFRLDSFVDLPSRLTIDRGIKVSWFEAECGDLALTLVGRMEHHAKATPHEPYFTWIAESGVTTTATFVQFRNDVVKKASWLFHKTALQKGDRVVLCFLPGYDFFLSISWHACIWERSQYQRFHSTLFKGQITYQRRRFILSKRQSQSSS